MTRSHQGVNIAIVVRVAEAEEVEQTAATVAGQPNAGTGIWALTTT